MVIVKFFLSLLVLDSQDVCFRVHSQTVICPIQDFQMSILGQNTAAKVPFFYLLPKYFVIKMHNFAFFVRKIEYLCMFFLELWKKYCSFVGE